jgi:hypothetical protein
MRASNTPFFRPRLAAALAASTWWLAACGGGSGNGTADTSPRDGTPNAAAVSQPGQLTAFVQQRLRKLNASGQLGASGLGSDLVPAALNPVAAAPSGGSTPARSSTLLQESGVDEADLLQSDGTYLYTLRAGYGSTPTVAAYRRGTDGRATRLSALDLPLDGASSLDSDGMHMSDDHRTLAVIARAWTMGPPPAGCVEACASLLPFWLNSSVQVQRVDVSNPAAAALGERLQIDGTLVDSRRIGNRLYVVTTWRPTLVPQVLPATASTADREAAIAALRPVDLLPRIRRNGASRANSEPLMSETDCYVREGNASTEVQLTTVTVFDLASPTLARSSRCVVGGTEALYMSATHLYLATTRWEVPDNRAGFGFPADIRTDIHKFALGTATDGASVSYRASGSVAGHLGWDREKTPYRFSEHNGDLRVLSFTGSFGWFDAASAGSTAPSPATLSILRERSSDQSLQPVATLPNSTRPAAIGKPGEQVYAVRFLGDRAYVVTFRRTDPLYVLDLSNPADPQTVGELEVAGFSEFLYSLPGGQLLGVGRDADSSGRATGLKFALFDVNDPAHPSQRASLTLGAVGSYSALDVSRHGLNLLQVGGVARVALPALLANTPYADFQQGLLKLEVDTTAGTIRNLGLAGVKPSASGPVWQERSLQIGEQLYYLSAGELSTLNW